MHTNRLSVSEIHQFLLNQGFNLTSDRILKQPYSSPETIWNILVTLSTPIKDARYQQLEPSLTYVVDSESVHHGLRKIKQYITVSSVLNQLGFNQRLPINDILKPEKQKTLDKLTMLVRANMYFQNITSQLEHSTLEQTSLEENLREEKRAFEQVSLQIQETKILKQGQKSQCEQKLTVLDNVKKQTNYKKKQKLDLLNLQQEIDNQVAMRKKNISEDLYKNSDLELQIKQLEREVIENAPKLKKQRIETKNQSETLSKTSNEESINNKKRRKIAYEILNRLSNLRQKNRILTFQQNCENKRQLTEEEQSLNQKMQRNKNMKNLLLEQKKQIFNTIQKHTSKKGQCFQDVKVKESDDKQKVETFKRIQHQICKYEETSKILQGKLLISKEHSQSLENKTKLKFYQRQQHISSIQKRMQQRQSEIYNAIKQTFQGFN